MIEEDLDNTLKNIEQDWLKMSDASGVSMVDILENHINNDFMRIIYKEILKGVSVEDGRLKVKKIQNWLRDLKKMYLQESMGLRMTSLPRTRSGRTFGVPRRKEIETRIKGTEGRPPLPWGDIDRWPESESESSD